MSFFVLSTTFTVLLPYSSWKLPFELPELPSFSPLPNAGLIPDSDLAFCEKHPWLGQKLANFSVKGHVVNTIGFAGSIVSVAITQPCQYGIKQPWTIHKSMNWMEASRTLLTKIGGGPDLTMGHSLPVPSLVERR